MCDEWIERCMKKLVRAYLPKERLYSLIKIFRYTHSLKYCLSFSVHQSCVRLCIQCSVQTSTWNSKDGKESSFAYTHRFTALCNAIHTRVAFTRLAVRFSVPPFDVCDRTAQVSVLNVKVSCFPETMNESFPTFFGNVGEAMKCAATSLCCWLLRWNLRKVK